MFSDIALILASWVLAVFGAWGGKSIANAAPFALRGTGLVLLLALNGIWR